MRSRVARSRRTCSLAASRRSQSTMRRCTSGSGSRLRSGRGGKSPPRPPAVYPAQPRAERCRGFRKSSEGSQVSSCETEKGTSLRRRMRLPVTVWASFFSCVSLVAQVVSPPRLGGVNGGGAVDLGQRVVLNPVFQGGSPTPPVQYQWRKNGVDLAVEEGEHVAARVHALHGSTSRSPSRRTPSVRAQSRRSARSRRRAR